MKVTKPFVSLFIVLAVLLVQTGFVLAAPALQDPATFTVKGLACGTDGTTVIVTYDDGDTNTPEVVVEVSLETAVTLELIAPNVECSDAALAGGIEKTIDPAALIPVKEESKHPVGAVLAAFFDFTNYDAIMGAHEDGTGFGVIAQALWLVKNNLKSDSEEDFLKILNAKKTGDYSDFDDYFEGETPSNWGQFKKAMLNGDKKGNLGQVMSDKEKPDNGKPDKSNNGNGSENSNKNKDKGN